MELIHAFLESSSRSILRRRPDRPGAGHRVGIPPGLDRLQPLLRESCRRVIYSTSNDADASSLIVLDDHHLRLATSPPLRCLQAGPLQCECRMSACLGESSAITLADILVRLVWFPPRSSRHIRSTSDGRYSPCPSLLRSPASPSCTSTCFQSSFPSGPS